MSAVVAAKTKAGLDWDLGIGAAALPDAKVRAYTRLTGTDKTKALHTATTKFVSDTLTPTYAAADDNVLFFATSGVTPAELLGGKLRLDVLDDDVGSDDYVGGCVQTVTPADFGGPQKDVNCAADADGVAVTVRYKITPL